ncbi:MAG TPA: chemotaxis response regulator protein-glutamate methylesterase, partial [Candidatus Angelobacter sp.]|nr:chemotaxis response regulator protein-glutamate methylesterase [Candidatus Angelobacter sp.]
MTNSGAHFRILLVDDSSVVRRVLTDVISADPQLEVAGTAPNGKIALERIAQLKPDLVILDIEMPEMDGLATLAALRKKYVRLPVIMFSTLTHRGASATLDALTLGADDYVPKERNSLGLAAAIDDLRRDLLPKIHALCSRDLGRDHRQARPEKKAPMAPPPPRLTEHRIDLVVIGVSTGGPDALCNVLPGIPRDFPVPIVIVQHMPAVFTKLLAERLSAKGAIPVKEAQGGEKLQPGTIWLAPGGKHLLINSSSEGLYLRVDETIPPRNYCRPSVDVLFESAVKITGARTLGVILTGMGSDGLDSCEQIRKLGGQVVVQDQATSVVWGMPGAVARAGLADA